MNDEFCVFERDENDSLDWRPGRAALPAGSSPVVMVNAGNAVLIPPQHHYVEDAVKYAEDIAGFELPALREQAREWNGDAFPD